MKSSIRHVLTAGVLCAFLFVSFLAADVPEALAGVYAIYPSSGPNGHMVPGAYVVYVGSGNSQRFDMYPDAGYHVENVRVDGVDKGSVTTYTFTVVTSIHYISVAFSANSTTVTASAGGGGAVLPIEWNQVYGAAGTEIIATPNTGYHFVAWTVTANPDYVLIADSTAASTTLATTALSPDGASATIGATFAIYAHTLSTGQIGNGGVSKSPSQATYDFGTVVQLVANPDVGWHFTSWSGDVPAGHETDNPLSLTMDADKTVTATFTEGPISSLVTHYYSSILGRTPDEPGRVYWVNEITRVQSLGIDPREGFIALARLFLTSEEYLGNGATDAVYVTNLYETFFNRTPSAGEVTYWTDLMTGGMTRDNTMNWFVYSAEYQAYMTSILGSFSTRPENNLVNDLYRGFLNRLPDTTGFTAQLNAMRAAQASDAAAVRSTTLAIALNFMTGPEYALRARTNTQFIEDCYNGILRRGALGSEIQGWVDLLTAGATRTEVLTGFVNSAEFQARVDQVIAAGPFIP